MAINGQSIKQDFYILNTTSESSNSGIVPNNANMCCFELPALAELSFTDIHKNDKHSVIWFYNELVPTANIYLQKQIAGTYQDVATITDNTYGIFSPFGFYIDKYNQKAIGFQIDWALILASKGQGVYRFRSQGTPSIGSAINNYGFDFKLQIYTDLRADSTVRSQWNRNGVLGSKTSDSSVDDYGILNWFNQIRIPLSIFGFPQSNIVRNNVKYQNGAQIWLQDEQIEELSWKIDSLPAEVLRFLQVDMLQSGKITITDYNSTNPVVTIDRDFICTSNFSPNWTANAPNADVTLTFAPYYQNLVHKRE